MKTYLLLAGLAAATMLTGSRPGVVRPQHGATLRIPDGQSLLLSVQAEGVQIYTGKTKAGSASKFEWVLKAPRATLFDQDHKKIGSHSFGPTWELNDGSKVVGVQPPKQRVDAANPNNVPWLLLEAKSHEGIGQFSRVTYILRVDTAGGVAPAKSPTREGQEVEVKYRASYVFLAAVPSDTSTIALMSYRDTGPEIYVTNGNLQGFHDVQYDDSGPAWSPDGKMVAFVRSLGMNYDIFVLNADGSAQKNLTNNAALFDYEPAWSPDGKKIAFVSNRDAFYQSEIYVMDADGSEQKRLTTCVNHEDRTRNVYPAWSPNGKKIAYTSTRDGNAEIYVMNVDGSGQTNLTKSAAGETDPLWSPDGKKIAFLRIGERTHEICVMNSDGSGQTMLTNGNDSDYRVAWSPGGKKISFLRIWDSYYELHIMNADGSGPIRLTTSGADGVGEAAWSPNGKRIAFRNNHQIHVMNADGSGRIKVSDDDAMRRASHSVAINGPLDFHPAWSPDGKKIAYLTFWDGTRDMYVMNSDGSGVKNLTGIALPIPTPPVRSLVGHKGAVVSVSFAKDGKTLASGGADGMIRLWNVVSGHEDKSLKLKTLASAMSAVAFAPDGLSLVSGDKNGNIVRWDVATGKQEPGPIILKSPNGVKQIVYSPDGTKLSVVTTKQNGYDNSASDRVTICDAKKLSEVKSLMEGYSTSLGAWPACSVAVSPDGALIAVAFSGFSEGSSFYDVWDSNGTRKLASFGQNFIRDNCLATFAPDGKAMVLFYAFKIFKVDLQLILNHQWWGENFPCLWQAEDTKVTILLCSPDGRTVVSYSGTRKKESGGRCIRLWDAATGALKMQVPDAGQINALAFSPDSRTLAGACDDGTVKLWDTSSLVAKVSLPSEG